MSPPGKFPVPDRIPGELVTDPGHLRALKEQLARITGMNSMR